MTTTSEQLRGFRERQGWTREQLARRLDVSVETVRSWETGRRPMEGPAARLVAVMMALLEEKGDRDDEKEDR